MQMRLDIMGFSVVLHQDTTVRLDITGTLGANKCADNIAMPDGFNFHLLRNRLQPY